MEKGTLRELPTETAAIGRTPGQKSLKDRKQTCIGPIPG